MGTFLYEIATSEKNYHTSAQRWKRTVVKELHWVWDVILRPLVVLSEMYLSVPHLALGSGILMS